MKILRCDDDENTWELRDNLAHLVVFKEYMARFGSHYATKSSVALSAQQKSAESGRKKNATPKKVIKNYAYKSPLALSLTRAAAKKADDDEQSDEGPQSEEDEDDGRDETAEIDESGKGIQTSICLFTIWADYINFHLPINEPNKLVLIEPTHT